MKRSLLLTALIAAACLRPVWAEAPKPVEKPADAVVLFDGTQESLDKNWVMRNKKPMAWIVKDGAMTSAGSDIMTKEKYTDYQLHVEFNEPKLPDNVKGEARGNSGVYMQGKYEIQVLDSYGTNPPGKGDCGAVYNQKAPDVNACLPPGEWQTYDISFTAPKFDGDKKTEEAKVTVIHNGKKIQDNVSIHHPTGSELTRDEKTPGPILLQFHHGAIQFRNVWIVPAK